MTNQTLAQAAIMAKLRAKMAAERAAKQALEAALQQAEGEVAARAEAERAAHLAQAEAAAKAQAEAAQVAALARTAAVGKTGVTYDMLNLQQKAAINMEAEGVSFCVTGSAGTGKTTIQRMLVRQALDSGRISMLADTNGHPLLRAGGPAVLIVSYTNVATNNIKSTLPPELAAHCMTIHKAVQYAPETMEVAVIDELGADTGETKESMRFIPTYGSEPTTFGGSGLGLGGVLPHFDLVIVEEAGTVPVYLYKTLRSALPRPDDTRWVFLGDIEQLEPAFGDGILGYAMLGYPYVRLSEVYRNVGLVTKFANRILTGRPISDAELVSWNKEDDSGKLEFRQFKKKATSKEAATSIIGAYFQREAREGRFDPDNTMVLLPWNKHLGSIAIGKWIAQGFQLREWKVVHEVKAGRALLHLCEGDRIFLNKSYFEIVSIEPNKYYMGPKPRPASRMMDRWGRLFHSSDVPQWVKDMEKDWLLTYGNSEAGDLDTEVDPLDALELLEMDEENLKASRGAASHKLKVRKVTTDNNMDDTAPTFDVGGVSDLQEMQFSYALTGHKAQGSEWENVYVIAHVSHSATLNREWLYTACTRARRNLTVMFDGEFAAGSTRSVFKTGILSQGIPGATLEQKLKHFRNKLGALYPNKEIAEAINLLNARS